jgi:hypothetical protein
MEEGVNGKQQLVGDGPGRRGVGVGEPGQCQAASAITAARHVEYYVAMNSRACLCMHGCSVVYIP